MTAERKVQATVRQAVRMRVMARSGFISVNRNGHAISEHGQKRADRHRDRAHRPHVHPNRHAKRCSRRGGDRSAKAGYDPNGQQEGRRTYRKALHPSGKPMQGFLQIEDLRGVQVDPVAEQGGQHETNGVDDGALDRTENRPVHDRQGVGHRERRRRHQGKNRDPQRVGKRTDDPNFVFDARLMADHPEGQSKGSDQQSQSGASPKEASQAMIVRAVITVLCGVGLYASVFMLLKSRRAALGKLSEPSVVQTARAQFLGIPNSALGALYYPALAVAVWFVRTPAGAIVVLAAAFGAAAMSVVLGYSLLFITRRPCPYCWTSHVANWLLLALSCQIFVPDVLSRGI